METHFLTFGFWTLPEEVGAPDLGLAGARAQVGQKKKDSTLTGARLRLGYHLNSQNASFGVQGVHTRQQHLCHPISTNIIPFNSASDTFIELTKRNQMMH